MRTTLFILCIASLICSLVSTAQGATKKPPRFPVPAGQYVGSYTTSEGDTGSLDISIDERGRISGGGVTDDGESFALSGSIKVNQKNGVATGKASYRGDDVAGSATVRIDGNTLSGTFKGRDGRVKVRGTYALTKQQQR